MDKQKKSRYIKRRTVIAVLLIVAVSLTAFSGCGWFSGFGSSGNRNNSSVGRSGDGFFQRLFSSLTGGKSYEAYYQEVTAEDITSTETGIVYAKNQLSLVASVDAYKEDIEELAESLDGEIVGYLELTGDYQLELSGTYSFEELHALASELEQDPLVDFASVHEFYEESEGNKISSFLGDLFDSSNAENAMKQDTWGDSWLDTTNANSRSVDYQTGVLNPIFPAGNNWWAEAVNLPFAWYFAEQSRLDTIGVCVFDNMFDASHPDINYSGGVNQTVTNLTNSHGTHVAGLVCATPDNTSGIRGGSPNTRLYAYAYTNNTVTMTDLDGDEQLRDLVSADEDTTNLSSVFNVKYVIATMLAQGVRLFNFSNAFGSLLCSAYYDAEISHLNAGNSYALQTLERVSHLMEQFIIRCSAVYPDFLILKAAGNYSEVTVNVTGNAPASGASLYGDFKNTRTTGTVDLGEVSSTYDYLGHISSNSPAREHILIVGAYDLNYSISLPVKDTDYTLNGDRSYSRASFSCTDADIYAPGGQLTANITQNRSSEEYSYEILSTVVESNSSRGATGMMQGTSMATPIVTGIAALVWGYQPELSSQQLRQCLLDQSYVLNRVQSYTSLVSVDALAAMKHADELLSGTGQYRKHKEDIGNKCFLIGFGYTFDDNGALVYAKDAVLHLFDKETWEEKYIYTMNEGASDPSQGDEGFALMVEPGEYYVRIISEELEKEYIGEIEVSDTGATFEAFEMVHRPTAMYEFASSQTRKQGEWYEAGDAWAGAEVLIFDAGIDYEYTMHVESYDPETNTVLRANGSGIISEYGIKIGVLMDCVNNVTSYSMYMLGIPLDMGDVYSSLEDIDPSLFDFSAVTEEMLTDVVYCEDYGFMVQMDSELLETLELSGMEIPAAYRKYGTLEVTLNDDLSLHTITFETSEEAGIGQIKASLGYRQEYTFSDTQIREPYTFETDPSKLMDFIDRFTG